MADFLERVSRMALGAAPVIQPLVASRYAPGAHVVVPEMLEREVTLESPAEASPTSVNEVPETARPEGDDPGTPHASMPHAATADRRRAAARREDLNEIAPAVVETPPSRRQPSVDAKNLTGADTNRVQELVEHVHASEEMPFHGEPGKPLSPPAIIEQGRPDIVNRFVEPAAVRTDPDRPPHVVEPPAVTGQRLESVVEEHVRFQNPIRNDSGHQPISAERGVMTGDREDAGAVSASVPRAFEPSLSPRAYSEVETQERMIRPRATSLRLGSHEPESSTARHTEADARAARQHGPEPASSRPVVRVTIGRVEVRAVLPPALPVQTPGAPAPKLSLDEYLRQHSGRPQ